MSAHQSHREIPAAYFKAVRAARAIFKWNNPGEVFDSPRDEYFSTLDSLLKELVQRVRTLTLTCAPKNVTSRLTYHCQGDDPALLVYRECCERACYTLMSRGVQVERIPSWENTERAPEHVRKHNYMNRLLPRIASLPMRAKNCTFGWSIEGRRTPSETSATGVTPMPDYSILYASCANHLWTQTTRYVSDVAC
jgi:hypothetical protein